MTLSTAKPTGFDGLPSNKPHCCASGHRWTKSLSQQSRHRSTATWQPTSCPTWTSTSHQTAASHQPQWCLSCKFTSYTLLIPCSQVSSMPYPGETGWGL